MKLAETIFIALAICFLIIGIHQSAMHGFTNSYWIFMLMISSMALYQLIKNKRIEKEAPPAGNNKPEADKKKVRKNK